MRGEVQVELWFEETAVYNGRWSWSSRTFVSDTSCASSDRERTSECAQKPISEGQVLSPKSAQNSLRTDAMFETGTMHYKRGAPLQRTEQGIVQHLEDSRQGFGSRHVTHRKPPLIKEADW